MSTRRPSNSPDATAAGPSTTAMVCRPKCSRILVCPWLIRTSRSDLAHSEMPTNNMPAPLKAAMTASREPAMRATRPSMPIKASASPTAVGATATARSTIEKSMSALAWGCCTVIPMKGVFRCRLQRDPHYPQYTLRRDPNRGNHDGPERTGPSWLPTPLPLTLLFGVHHGSRLPPDW